MKTSAAGGLDAFENVPYFAVEVGEEWIATLWAEQQYLIQLVHVEFAQEHLVLNSNRLVLGHGVSVEMGDAVLVNREYLWCSSSGDADAFHANTSLRSNCISNEELLGIGNSQFADRAVSLACNIDMWNGRMSSKCCGLGL